MKEKQEDRKGESDIHVFRKVHVNLREMEDEGGWAEWKFKTVERR